MTVETDWLAGADAAPRNVGGRPAKDHRGRQRKLLCSSCGFIAYATAGALARPDTRPTCCGEPLELPNLRDRAAVEPDALLDDLARLPLREQNATYRELGWTDLIVPLGRDGRIVNPERRSGAAQKTCQWDGGYCVKFTSGRYCPEHDPHAIAAREREARRAA